jgi:uncharacterized protein YeaO (DUF488 family)
MGQSVGKIEMARVYDEFEDTTSLRVLVDRLWPRGLAKSDAPFSVWAKDVAPSTELRRWYDHVEARFEEFAQRYRDELASTPAREALTALRQQIGGSDVILLTATKEAALSHVVVLRAVLPGP